MGFITEKEWTIDVSRNLKVDFFAKLDNNVVAEIFVKIDLDGFYVTWNPLHNHSMIPVYFLGKLENNWIMLLDLLGDQSKVVEESLKEFLNNNLTYKN